MSKHGASRMTKQTILKLATAVIADPDNRILLVKKRHSESFMQPGGKIESNESPEMALVRELKEELRVQVSELQCLPLGTFCCAAANEPNTSIDAKLFFIAGEHSPNDFSPSAEIAEIRWLDPNAPGSMKLAPLTKDYVIPLWLRAIEQSVLPKLK